MIQGKVIPPDKISHLITVWSSVFYDEELCIELNEKNIYTVLYEGIGEDNPIGAAVLKLYNDECYLEKVAILSNKRNNKNGEFLLRFIIDKGFSKGYEKIYTMIKNKQKKFFYNVGFESTKKDKINSDTIKCEISPDKFYKQCRK